AGGLHENDRFLRDVGTYLFGMIIIIKTDGNKLANTSDWLRYAYVRGNHREGHQIGLLKAIQQTGRKGAWANVIYQRRQIADVPLVVYRPGTLITVLTTPQQLHLHSSSNNAARRRSPARFGMAHSARMFPLTIVSFHKASSRSRSEERRV